LRAFAATPGEIVEEVFPADAVRAGWGIDFGLASDISIKSGSHPHPCPLFIIMPSNRV
jgi:hypothetical protein